MWDGIALKFIQKLFIVKLNENKQLTNANGKDSTTLFLENELQSVFLGSHAAKS